MSDMNLFIGITIIVLLLMGCASPAPVYKIKCIPLKNTLTLLPPIYPSGSKP